MQNKRRGDSRKIVLIDLENMLFGDHEAPESPKRAMGKQIVTLAEARRPTDLLIVGCNPQLAFVAKDLFPTARIVTGKGKDGADMALIDTIDPRHAASRFSELCIVSGDHAFTELAHEARLAGLAVRVVAPHAGLSTELRLQANTSIFLPAGVRAEVGGFSSELAA